MQASAGRRLKALIEAPEILVLPGVFDGFSTRLVSRAGYPAAFITGSGVSESRLGQPDVGIMGLEENVAAARAIAACSDLLLLADADTGYGNAVNVYHTVRAFERAGVAGLMLEDQVWPKRCGHMKGKEVIPADRVASLPSAASLADLGIPNEETILWRALLAPKGTPPERVALLENAFEKAANSPAARKFLEDAGEQVAIKKGATLKRYIDAEYEAMGKLAKALNLAPQ